MVSVIVPVYKSESFLHRCVDSILAQTFTDFELILVDDGSPDNCPSICDEYASNDRRIKVVHQDNHGQAYARNVGIDIAMANETCQYIAFIDSDDWVTPDYLATLYAYMTDDVDISVCRYQLTNGETVLEDTGANVSTCQYLSGRDACRLMMTDEPVSFVVPWGKLIRKSLLRDVRFPQLPMCEDEAIAHELFYAAQSVAFLPNSNYFYFTNSNSVMNGKPFSERNYKALSAFYDRILFYQERYEDNLAVLTKKILINKMFSFYQLSKKNRNMRNLTKQIKSEMICILEANRDDFPILPYRNIWKVKYGFCNPFYWAYCVCLYLKTYGFVGARCKMKHND